MKEEQFACWWYVSKLEFMGGLTVQKLSELNAGHLVQRSSYRSYKRRMQSRLQQIMEGFYSVTQFSIN